MTGHRIHLKGYKVKDGKVIRDPKRLDVSARLRERGSKKVRVVKKGAVDE